MSQNWAKYILLGKKVPLKPFLGFHFFVKITQAVITTPSNNKSDAVHK